MVWVDHRVTLRHVDAMHVRVLLSERHACDMRKDLGYAIDLGRLSISWQRVTTREADHGGSAVVFWAPLIGEYHVT